MKVEYYADHVCARSSVRRQAFAEGWDRRLRWELSVDPPRVTCLSWQCPFLVRFIEPLDYYDDEDDEEEEQVHEQGNGADTQQGKAEKKKKHKPIKVTTCYAHNAACRETFNPRDGPGYGIPEDVRRYLDAQLAVEKEQVLTNPMYKRPPISELIRRLAREGMGWDKTQVSVVLARLRSSV